MPAFNQRAGHLPPSSLEWDLTDSLLEIEIE